MANMNFNPNEHKPAEFELIPAGVYPAIVTASEIKPTKDATGQMLALTWQIVDGQHKGRIVFQNLNIVNKNPKAVEIANGELSAICKAMGLVNTVQDSSELHNLPVNLKIKITPAKGEYDAKNEFKGVAAYGSAPAGAAAPPPVAAPPAPPTQAAPPQAAPSVYDQAAPAPAPAGAAAPPWQG